MCKFLKWAAILIGGTLVVVLALGVIGAITASPEQKAQWAKERAQREQQRQREKEAEDNDAVRKKMADEIAIKEAKAKEAQFKCAEQATGGMFDFRWELKKNLREPDSYDEISAMAAPVDGDGTQLVRIKYRAKNGFGGMNIAMAEARLSVRDCKLLSWRSLE